MTDVASSLDLTLVAGRRPALLERTLQSFEDKIFQHFPLTNVWVNLDPVFGDEDAHAATKEVVRRHFPNARIFEPATASFGMAVKRVWGAVTGPLAFHLEDDWVCSRAIAAGEVTPLLKEDTASVILHAANVAWRPPGTSFRKTKHRRLLGIPLAPWQLSVFTTSPQFLRGTFARETARRLNPDLDPEKQMRDPSNRELFAYQQQFTARWLSNTDGEPLIRDIGREWRDARGINKTLVEGRSVWAMDQRTPPTG